MESILLYSTAITVWTLISDKPNTPSNSFWIITYLGMMSILGFLFLDYTGIAIILAAIPWIMLGGLLMILGIVKNTSLYVIGAGIIITNIILIIYVNLQ